MVPRAQNIAEGSTIFLLGLAKKVVLADTFRALRRHRLQRRCRAARRSACSRPGTPRSSYALQIYFDFSGYSDMAIGLARMLNVRFPLNFASPYQATQHRRLLAPLAYHPRPLSARLRLYPPGRQPARRGAA